MKLSRITTNTDKRIVVTGYTPIYKVTADQQYEPDHIDALAIDISSCLPSDNQGTTKAVYVL